MKRGLLTYGRVHLTFADQDDELTKGYEGGIAELSESDADLLILNAQVKYSGSYKKELKNVVQRELATEMRCKQLAASLLSDRIIEPRDELQHVGPQVWSNLFRRAFIERHHIRFERILHNEDDWRFSMKMLVALSPQQRGNRATSVMGYEHRDKVNL